MDTAKSRYDSTLTNTVNKNSITSQNADPFSGTAGNNFREETFIQSQWNDPTIWGGNFDVFLRTQRRTFSPGLSILDSNYATIRS